MSGAGINSAILGKLRKESPPPQIPNIHPISLNTRGAWCRNEKAETITVMNLSMFIKVHPQPLSREPNEVLGFLTSHGIIKTGDNHIKCLQHTAEDASRQSSA